MWWSIGRFPSGIVGLTVLAALTCARPAAPEPPAPRFPVGAVFAGGLVYVGLDVAPWPPVAGQPVRLVHHWRVLAPPAPSWRVFTHVTAPDGLEQRRLASAPSFTAAGALVRDEQVLVLPGVWQHPSAEIYVGLWRGPERMKATGAPDGRLHVASMPVAGAIAPVAALRHVATRVTAGRNVVVDGNLDEPAWRAAHDLAAFVDAHTGWPAPGGVRVRVLWDRARLYVGVVAEATDDESVELVIRGRDGDPIRVPIALQRRGQARSAELGLPLTAITLSPGAVLGFNVIRRGPDGPRAIWSRDGQLGELVLGDERGLGPRSDS